MSKVIRKNGRPSLYSQALVTAICDRLIKGESLRSICRDEDMPSQSTIFNWLTKYPEFSEQYVRAREIWIDFECENILAIADDGSKDTYFDKKGNKRVNHDAIAHSKLRIDVRKWRLAKMSPRKYGRHTIQEISNRSTESQKNNAELVAEFKALERMIAKELPKST